jgi:hypothetical protein
MFRKFVAVMALTLAAATSFAGQSTIDTSGLTEAQVAEIKAYAAKQVADVARAAAQPATPEQVTAGVTLAATWGQQAAAAAEGFAKAMGIAAKELNVTINDFLKSDAGKLTAILIIWKVAGAAIVKSLYGLLFVTVGLTMVRVIYTRLFTKGYEKVEYSRFGGFFKGTKMIRIPKSFHDLENDGEWLAFWVMIALTLATLVFGGMFF